MVEQAFTSFGRVVVDKSNATARYTGATFLANQGVPTRADYRYAIMHDAENVNRPARSSGRATVRT
jgi:chorismate synthase